MGCASSSSQYEAQSTVAEEQTRTEPHQATQPKSKGICISHNPHKLQVEKTRQQRTTRDDFNFPADPDPNRISPEGHVDEWKWKNKPVGMMDCAGCDLFGIDVTLPDGREVRLEELSQTDFIGDAKKKVFTKGELPLENLDDFVLVYYGCWMGDEFMLNSFGIPWNGTCLSLQSKVQLQQQAAAGITGA